MVTRRQTYPRWYESIPSARDRHTVKEYAAYLSQVEWQVYATFTFAWPVSDPQADKVFSAYIDAMEREFSAPIGFIRGDEKRWSGCGQPASPRHFHVLMTSTVPLDADWLQERWWQFGGAGRRVVDDSGHTFDSVKVVVRFDPQQKAEYCLKFINEADGDWKPHNLDLFVPGHPRTARARSVLARQARRDIAPPMPSPVSPRRRRRVAVDPPSRPRLRPRRNDTHPTPSA